ncbi:DUF1616 domain-containing protein [Chloroflexota bacterium]
MSCVGQAEYLQEKGTGVDWLSPVRELFSFALPLLKDLSAVRVILGLLLMFFLPGFAWSLVFFRGRQINVLERIVLSIGLSIAIVSLSILSLNRLTGLAINGFNAALIIIIATIIPVVIYYLNKLIRARVGRD